MRRLAYVGLILLLIGLVCVVYGEVGLSNVKRVEAGETDFSVWNATRTLVIGETYYVYIESADDWGVPFQKGDFTEPMPVNMTIASPSGATTDLQAFYYGLSTTSPLYKEGMPPSIVDVRYRSVDADSLTVDRSVPEIRFSVRQTGNYTLLVFQQGLWSKEPPNYITFYKELSENRGAYSFLAFAGGLTGTVGGVTFVVGAFRKESARRKKTRKPA